MQCSGPPEGTWAGGGTLRQPCTARHRVLSVSIDPAQKVSRTARLCTPGARHIVLFSPQYVSVIHAWVTLVNLEKACDPAAFYVRSKRAMEGGTSVSVRADLLPQRGGRASLRPTTGAAGGGFCMILFSRPSPPGVVGSETPWRCLLLLTHPLP